MFYNKSGKYILTLTMLIGIPFMSANIFYHDIQHHEVEIQEKSPLFPYSKYDYMTTEDTFYTIDGNPDVVPSFFRTDFASIPKALWFIDAPYKASFIYPAVWHDFNYTCPGNLSRKEIDDIFYDLLRYEGNSIYTSLKMYIAVRIFGFNHFAKNQNCKDLVIQQEADEKFYSKENSNG